MNTLTDLIPDIYAALNVVGRELVGFLPSIYLNNRLERAAVGQTLRIPIAPAAAAEDITPGQLPPDTGDQTVTNTTFTITKARRVPFNNYGEENKGLAFGPGHLTIRAQNIAQAMRTLVNEMEADVALLYKKASRAYGTSGTTPFASDFTALLHAKKILIDNGCPDSDINLVMDTTAGVNMRGLGTLNKVNESGTSSLLRQGIIGELHNVAIRESAQVKLHTKGTGTSYQTNGAQSLAEKSIDLDTGSGTIVAGDVVTLSGDTNQYVTTTALTAGVLTIGSPGLRAAAADNLALTVTDGYRANMLFHRNSIIGAIRPPALPDGGDAAIDRMLVQDPWSGMVFEISVYAQYRKLHWEIAAAWGFDVIKPDHIALIKG